MALGGGRPRAERALRVALGALARECILVGVPDALQNAGAGLQEAPRVAAHAVLHARPVERALRTPRRTFLASPVRTQLVARL